MKIVQFENGKYMVRRWSITAFLAYGDGYEFLDLTYGNYASRADWMYWRRIRKDMNLTDFQTNILVDAENARGRYKSGRAEFKKEAAQEKAKWAERGKVIK